MVKICRRSPGWAGCAICLGGEWNGGRFLADGFVDESADIEDEDRFPIAQFGGSGNAGNAL